MFKAAWRVSANALRKEGTEETSVAGAQTEMGNKEPRGAEEAGSRPHRGLEVIYGFNQEAWIMYILKGHSGCCVEKKWEYSKCECKETSQEAIAFPK